METYLISFGWIVALYIAFRITVAALVKLLTLVSDKTETDFDDSILHMVQRTKWWVFALIAFGYIKLTLVKSEVLTTTANGLLDVLSILLFVKVASHWLEYFILKAAGRRTSEQERTVLHLVGKGISIILWVLGFLFLVSSFGYNISSLLTGLGVGGIAVALAVQNILGDLISCLSIYLDKPFKVGDFITVGSHMGTVKSIGLKTTRLTSIQGEEIVMSNKKLTESDVNNFGKMKKRRAVISLGVTYDTKLAQMRKIPKGLSKIINSIEDATFDRAHFKEYSDSSKDFELVFFVESKDYYTYMDRLEEVNLEIQKFFEKNKIDFAFPTRTVHMKR